MQASSNPMVAALQMVSGREIPQNLDQAEGLIAKAAEQGAQLVVLPETFVQMAANRQVALGLREFESAELQAWLSEVAIRYQVWIVAGSIPLAPDASSDKVWASCFIVNSEGEIVGRYDKMHLFDVDVADSQGAYRESDQFLHGQRTVVVDTPFGRVGVAICYDLRFPLLFDQLMNQGVELLAVPAAFTRYTGLAHWLPLLRARAIELQCAVIGANQGGEHSRRRQTSGGSVILDAWGTVQAELGFGPGVALATVDLEAQRKIRRDMPVVSHRRFCSQRIE